MTRLKMYKDQPVSRKPSRMIWLIGFSVLMLGVWANYAELDEVVRGSGKVVPTSQTQVIQSLEGGIISTLPVWEGKEVQLGETLATLSDSKFKGAFEELETKALAFEARLIRLDKEINYANSLVLPHKICDLAPDVCESERHFFQASLREYRSTTQSLNDAIGYQKREVDMKEAMSAKRILPQIDVLKAQQSYASEKARLAEYKSDYQTSRAKEYADVLTELNQIKAQMSYREDQLSRTALKAPARGVVNKILITTIGGVAPPGEPILELTPLDDQLRIEAKISPRDVAFIRRDMKATIKLTAYDFSIYGSLSGQVTHVSADTFEDPKDREAQPYYKVFISVDPASLSRSKGNDIDIRPGMTGNVELHTGEKTVLQYLLKPLFKTREAFREP